MSWEPILTIALGVFIGFASVLLVRGAMDSVEHWWRVRQHIRKQVRR